MNSKLLLTAIVFLAGRSLGATEAPAPCCVPETGKAAVADACCAIEPSASVAMPLSARSLYQLETFWTNDAGKTMNLAELRGRPVVLAMFFASCEYACPILVHDIQRIREKLPAQLQAETRVVLVSFDDVRDTPAALRAYRSRAGLDDGWALLRGAPSSVEELAMLLGVKYKQDTRGQYSHSNLITVLNAEGEIVHQRSGLQGEVNDAVKALVSSAR